MMKPSPTHCSRRVLSILGILALLICILPSAGVAATISGPERVTLDAYEGYTQPVYTGIALQMDVPLETVSLQWQNQWMAVTNDADWQAMHPDMPLLVTVFPGMPEGIHTDTILLTAQDGATAVIPVVFTVRPNRLMTPPQITFGEVHGYTGEVFTAAQISIDGTVNNLQVSSSNPDISASLSSSSMVSGDQVLLTVKARNGLDPGDHTALITLMGDHCTGVVPVTFSVSMAQSLHAPQGVSFSAIHGYTQPAETTAEVGVSGMANNLHAESDNRSIEVYISPTNINGGEKAIMTFRAVTGLPVGKHTAYVVLSADGFLPVTFPVTFTVNQSNSLSAPNEIPFTLREGYQGQPATTAQIGVTGTASNLRATSSNPAIEAFIQPDSLSGTQTATLTLRARPGLAPNRYVSVITLDANECSTNISVVLQVEASSDAGASAAWAVENVVSVQSDPVGNTAAAAITISDVPIAPSATPGLPIVVNVMESAEPTATPAPQGKNGSIFNCNEWVNVRSGPGTEYPEVGRAPLGESVELLEWNDAQDWCRVRLLGQGGEGWVYAKFIRRH